MDADTFSSHTATAADWLDRLDLLLSQTRQATGKPWVDSEQLQVAYQAHYATSLAAIAQHNHCSLKELLAQSDRFALYHKPIAGHFYVARRADLEASYQPRPLTQPAPQPTRPPAPAAAPCADQPSTSASSAAAANPPPAPAAVPRAVATAPREQAGLGDRATRTVAATCPPATATQR